MSGYRLVPTFRLARRIAHDLHHNPMKSLFPRHWKQMTDHHLGMMERVFNDGEGIKPIWSRRRWMNDAVVPSWWSSCTMDGQHSSKREFGRVEFGEDAQKFEILVDLGSQVKPDDVDINVRLVNDNELHIEARHESGSPETGEFRKQFFSKVLSMPSQVDLVGLKSTVSDEGLLRVEAPMLAIEEQPCAPVREIPIERSTSKTTENLSPETPDKESKTEDPTK